MRETNSKLSPSQPLQISQTAEQSSITEAKIQSQAEVAVEINTPSSEPPLEATPHQDQKSSNVLRPLFQTTTAST
jgi:hypothetical protein